MGSCSFSYCKCGAIAQTGDNVASECNMHWTLQGARGRTLLDKNKRLWLGTLLTAFNPDNTIKICSKKIKHGSQSYLCVLLKVNIFTC